MIGGLDQSGRTTQAELLNWNLEGFLFCFPNYGLWSGKRLMLLRQQRLHERVPEPYYHLCAYNAHESYPEEASINPELMLIGDGAWADLQCRCLVSKLHAQHARALLTGLPSPHLTILLTDTHGEPQNALRRSMVAYARSHRALCVSTPYSKYPHESANLLQAELLEWLYQKRLVPERVPMRYRYDKEMLVCSTVSKSL
jgi:hypothetical protein